MCKSILNPTITPKTSRFPKGLIYNVPKTNTFRLADSEGKLVGEMKLLKRFCKNSSFYKTEPDGTTLHIYSLDINESEWGKGWGSYFLDFAKKESYKRGCKGRCSLVAHYPGRPPHIFYKKNGFITPKPDLNEFLDECIKTGARPNSFTASDMFIPIKEFMIDNSQQENKESPIKTFFQKLWNNIFSQFFNKF